MKKKTIAGLIAIVVIASVAIFAGCVEKEDITPPTPTPFEPSVVEDLGDKSILMVIAPKDFRDEELFEPKEIFEEKGAKITVASTSTDTAKGMLSGTVKPDLKISDVNVEEYDVIVIVGGVGSEEYLWGDEELRILVKEAYNKDKIVSAICLSPVVLARAGILEGKQATVFPDREAIDELKRNGANYLDRSVVVSDGVITGRDPESAEEFALKIWDTLKGTEEGTPALIQPSKGKPDSYAKPLISFDAREGEDRTVTVKCSGCGTIFSHAFTLGQMYICPKCKKAFKEQTNIAIIKDGVVFAPLGSIIEGLRPDGVRVSTTQTTDAERVTGREFLATIVVTLRFQSNKGWIKWSDNSSFIEVNGQVQKLSGEPFKEYAERVAFPYGGEPRYEKTIRISTSGGELYGYKRITITFVPLKDFVEPLGYKVEQIGNMVTVYKEDAT